MKVTLCGSIAFYERMLDVKSKLEEMAHEVRLPPSEVIDESGNSINVGCYYELRKREKGESGWIWDRKAEAMRTHFDKVAWSNSILVLNYDKNGVMGYVGANTFLEMGLAFYLDKGIYLLKSIPDCGHKEEILAMKPKVISDDLSLIV